MSPDAWNDIPHFGVKNATSDVESTRQSQDLTRLIPSARKNVIAPNTASILSVPRCHLSHSASMTITTATLTTIGVTAPTTTAFNTERFDTDDMHATAPNPGRITIKTSGTYLVGATIFWDANATGQRIIIIRMNGATRISEDTRPPVAVALAGTIQTTSTIYQFVKDDYLEVQVFQDSGGGLDDVAFGVVSPQFWACMISTF